MFSEDDRDAPVHACKRPMPGATSRTREMDERLHQAHTATTHAELVSALTSLPQKSAGATITVAHGMIVDVEELRTRWKDTLCSTWRRCRSVGACEKAQLPYCFGEDYRPRLHHQSGLAAVPARSCCARLRRRPGPLPMLIRPS